MLFHMGSLTFSDGRHLTISVDMLDAPDGEQFKDIVEGSLRVLDPYRHWITDEEYEQYRHGEDIWVTGNQVCQGEGGRQAAVLFQIDNGCVIQGQKETAKTWLDKLVDRIKGE